MTSNSPTHRLIKKNRLRLRPPPQLHTPVRAKDPRVQGRIIRRDLQALVAADDGIIASRDGDVAPRRAVLGAEDGDPGEGRVAGPVDLDVRGRAGEVVAVGYRAGGDGAGVDFELAVGGE